MKTLNTHPKWMNSPLRLSKEEIDEPMLVIEDFFESYHLNEVREMLWKWMVEVVCSSRGVSIEPNDRSDHIYFYEKMEMVIEAAFIMQKRIDIS